MFILIRGNQILNGFGLLRANPKDPTHKGDQHLFFTFIGTPKR